MTNSAWLQLFPNLPQSWKDSLVVKTVNGTELSVQSIVRIDESFLVVRGRVAGTTEQGQVYFIPIEKLETICIQKPPKEDEMQKSLNEIFGPVGAPVPSVEKTSDSPRATTMMRLSPEAHERLKSLAAASKQPNPPNS